MLSNSEKEEFLSLVDHLFVETATYTKPFDLSIESLDADSAGMRFAMNGDLTGSIRTRNLHGGAIATVLDLVGSLAAFSNLVSKMKGQSLQKRVQKINRLNTIDLRIDYLRPAAGESFLATGYILRTGNKVAVTRMELYNGEDRLLAVGTATYIIGLAT